MKHEQQNVAILLENSKFGSIQARNIVKMRIKVELLRISAR